MNRQRLSQQVMEAVLIALLLAGCGAPAASPTPTLIPPTATSVPPTPTPVPPTATPTKPPTATSTPAFTLATTAEEIVGTWLGKQVYYIRFDKDGTYRQAHALDKLDSRPYAISSYQFEGAKMATTEASVFGVPSCGKTIGSYEIRLLPSGNIQIVTIKDECAGRRGDTAGEYRPVR